MNIKSSNIILYTILTVLFIYLSLSFIYGVYNKEAFDNVSNDIKYNSDSDSDSLNSNIDINEFINNNPKINLIISKYYDKYEKDIKKNGKQFLKIYSNYWHKLFKKYILRKNLQKLSINQKKKFYLKHLVTILQNMPEPNILLKINNIHTGCNNNCNKNTFKNNILTHMTKEVGSCHSNEGMNHLETNKGMNHLETNTGSCHSNEGMNHLETNHLETNTGSCHSNGGMKHLETNTGSCHSNGGMNHLETNTGSCHSNGGMNHLETNTGSCHSLKQNKFKEKGWVYLPDEVEKARKSSKCEPNKFKHNKYISNNHCHKKCDLPGQALLGFNDHFLSFSK